MTIEVLCRQTDGVQSVCVAESGQKRRVNKTTVLPTSYRQMKRATHYYWRRGCLGLTLITKCKDLPVWLCCLNLDKPSSAQNPAPPPCWPAPPPPPTITFTQTAPICPEARKRGFLSAKRECCNFTNDKISGSSFQDNFSVSGSLLPVLNRPSYCRLSIYWFWATPISFLL